MAERTLTVEITGMHCASCAILVDDCVEDLAGVRSSRTSLSSGRAIVTADAAVTAAQVLAAVAEAGYTGRVVDT